MNTAELNLAWADALFAGLVAAGIRHTVFGPGARSAPLAAACLRRPDLTSHVINDERAAGFFALGIGKATGIPAVVFTTSGTAAANLLPAVMEARLARVPLIVLTADRPPDAVGWGANQTVDQMKLFGDQVRAFHALPLPQPALLAEAFLPWLTQRWMLTATGPLPGPVHANVPFGEPLLPDHLPPAPPWPAEQASRLETNGGAGYLSPDLARVVPQLSGQPGVILCGEARYPAGFTEAITRLAAALEAPLVADPLSNLRHGPHDRTRLITHAARFLRNTQLPSPAWVLRCGAFPVSRTLEHWLASLDTASSTPDRHRHLLVAAPGEWFDPRWQTTARLEGNPTAIATELARACRPAALNLLRAWQAAEADAARTPLPFFEGAVARSVLERLPPDSHCFVGNSLAIRAVDAFGGSHPHRCTLHGNRGASGIDGNLATAAGIAAATRGPVALLVGDQTLLHDAGSLALLARHDAVIVLLDNGGGGIFDHLPLARTLPPDLLEQGWTAPPRIDFTALAQAYGLHPVVRITNASDLHLAIDTAFETGGAWLLHVKIDRLISRQGFAT